MRRSLYFKNKMMKNSKILKSDLKVIRPFVELAPNQISKVLGKKVKTIQSVNQLVKLKNIKN